MNKFRPTDATISVAISEIEKSIDLMMRIELNQGKVSEYAMLMRSGAFFPPIDVAEVDGTLMLTNGFHRVEASKQNGKTEIVAKIRLNATYEDAQDDAIASLRANSFGGLKHSSADKQKAVLMCLNMERHKLQSTRVIASMCGVSHELVAKIRKRLLTAVNNLQPETPTDAVDSAPTRKRKSKKKTKAVAPFKPKPPPPVNLERPPDVFEGLTPEQIAALPPRHVYTRKVIDELAVADRKALREFTFAVRDFGTAARKFQAIPRFFEPDEYLKVAATMENGGAMHINKLLDALNAIISAARELQPFVTMEAIRKIAAAPKIGEPPAEELATRMDTDDLR